MKEVLLWVQTSEPATVKFVYWDQQEPDITYETQSVRSSVNKSNVVKLVANRLEPGRKYRYQLILNDTIHEIAYPLAFQTQKLWQWREDPPDFRFALGSCNYVNEEKYDRPGKPYGGGYDIFERIRSESPDFMIWLGDNVYLREADWDSRTGILHRYTHTRSLAEIQPLLGSTHHYAIWDDHDYGPNDSDRGYWNKQITSEVFQLFWGNPNYNLTDEGGVTGTFFWQDVQFFLLDDRYFRGPNHLQDSTKSLLGREQLQWLKDALISSQATFKFICMGGQVLNPGKVYENYANYPKERNQLLLLIKEIKTPGVIFLTGDRHHAELTKLESDNFYPLYDFTVSPLTAGTHTPDPEENELNVPGTMFNKRNYGVIRVEGSLTNRRLVLEIHDNRGVLIWDREILGSDLQVAAD